MQCPKAQATHNVNNIDVKLIGLLKNGETKSLEITDEQTVVFLSSSTMTAVFTIPSGACNVSLIAQPKFKPSEGNPFTITENKQ